MFIGLIFLYSSLDKFTSIMNLMISIELIFILF